MKSLRKRSLSILLVLLIAMMSISGCAKKSDTKDGEKQPSVTVAPTQKALTYPAQPETLGSGDVKWSETETPDGYVLVTNDGGKTLGYSKASGTKIIQVNGLAFKDLSKNGLLDQYEDWRLDAETRAASLSKLLPIESIAGLMVFSAHQLSATEQVTDDQKKFLDTGTRAVLSAASADPVEMQAKWSNAMQVYVEGKDFGIPVNFSSDPRTVNISVWPSNLGLAATFDPSISLQSAKTLQKEYRYLGIGTYLGPQIDLASEPRWVRFSGTFGEDPALSRDMTNAFVSGMQSTYDENGNDLGWGDMSMNAMIKHWPGDGAAEGGRESHAEVGKYQVYPGGQFTTHLIPFVDGGLKLSGKTGTASAVMTSYSIAVSDGSLGEAVGSGYSEYKMNLLRKTYGFDGVICTDWLITYKAGEGPFGFGMPWGVENLSIAERIYKSISAGVDQLGGVSDATQVMDAYKLGVKEQSEDAMRTIFEASAVRLLRNYFQIGLFENPYVDVAKAKQVVASKDAVDAGYQAQQKSVVMLKNSGNVIKAATGSEKPTVYIPMVYIAAGAASAFGPGTPAVWKLPVDSTLAGQYFNVVTDKVSTKLTGPKDDKGKPTVSEKDIVRASKADLAKCDYALAVISNPVNSGSYFGGYGFDTVSKKYVPMTLQYDKYTAKSASVRKESLGGNTVDGKKENRSYFGNSTTATNSTDLKAVLYAADNMPKDKPVIVAVKADRPMVFSEFESKVDAIIVGFGIAEQALLDVAAGKYEPSGLLPMQMPKDMEAAEAQLEDVPRDMVCYVDSEGNKYDFAYGLNWKGVIQDERTAKYNIPALVNPTNAGK